MRYSFYYRLLEVLLKEIVPATRISVAKGNKIFGAAIINKFDLSTICIGTNNINYRARCLATQQPFLISPATFSLKAKPTL